MIPISAGFIAKFPKSHFNPLTMQMSRGTNVTWLAILKQMRGSLFCHDLLPPTYRVYFEEKQWAQNVSKTLQSPRLKIIVLFWNWKSSDFHPYFWLFHHFNKFEIFVYNCKRTSVLPAFFWYQMCSSMSIIGITVLIWRNAPLTKCTEWPLHSKWRPKVKNRDYSHPRLIE